MLLFTCTFRGLWMPDDSTVIGWAVCGSAAKNRRMSSCRSVWRRMRSSNSASSDSDGSSPWMSSQATSRYVECCASSAIG